VLIMLVLPLPPLLLLLNRLPQPRRVKLHACKDTQLCIWAPMRGVRVCSAHA